MRAHLDLLGRLYVVWGAFGLLGGVSLLILASGAAAAASGQLESRLGIGAIILALAASLPIAGGALSLWTGRALRRGEPRGRLGALTLGLPNLFVLPFGTALGIYSYWVLLNNQVREMFTEPHEG
ncbi:MAG: hypothetical protein M3Q55_08615 [Acidobacteriota bacterium]|nr:hypothetical protein [Acidobacteriota bacterium]